MESWPILVRWIHVIAASAWLGEVIVINFALVPALGKIASATRRRVLFVVFPRLFRLASVLSSTAVISGLVLAVRMSNGNGSLFLSGRWGRSILIGGLLGLTLMLFHFFIEQRIGGLLDRAKHDENGSVDEVWRSLKIIPRAGMGVILVIFGLMMFAVRGI